MPRTKKKSVCTCKPMPVITDNDESESDTVDTLATAEQPESQDVLSQETAEKKKGMLRLPCLLTQKMR